MTEELRELSPDMLIAKVMGNQDMVNALVEFGVINWTQDEQPPVG